METAGPTHMAPIRENRDVRQTDMPWARPRSCCNRYRHSPAAATAVIDYKRHRPCMFGTLWEGLNDDREDQAIAPIFRSTGLSGPRRTRTLRSRAHARRPGTTNLTMATRAWPWIRCGECSGRPLSCIGAKTVTAAITPSPVSCLGRLSWFPPNGQAVLEPRKGTRTPKRKSNSRRKPAVGCTRGQLTRSPHQLITAQAGIWGLAEPVARVNIYILGV